MPTIITRTREQVYELWIASLLSGQYLQAQDALRSTVYDDGSEVGTGFCCVGVLCDLANKDRNEPWEGNTFRTEQCDVAPNGSYHVEYDSSEMPSLMRQFMGLTPAECAELYKMNDQTGKTFYEIAEYIRTELMPNALQRPMPF